MHREGIIAEGEIAVVHDRSTRRVTVALSQRSVGWWVGRRKGRGYDGGGWMEREGWLNRGIRGGMEGGMEK